MKQSIKTLGHRFFARFEAYAQPFARPIHGRPPADGVGFIVHHAKQVRGPFTIMLVLGGLTALVEVALFTFVGWIVDMMNASGPRTFWADHWPTLLAMAFMVLVIRAAIAVATAVLEEQIIVPDFFTLTRWQSHVTVSRQDVSFFDDEMAGRVSSKVWQTGQAAGDVMVSLLQIIWFICAFAITSLVVIAALDPRLLLPVLSWLVGTGLIAWFFVPRIRDRGRASAEASARVTGRIVDGYSNIRTIKLYGAEAANDTYVREAWDEFLTVLRRFTRAIAGMRIVFQTMSSIMLVIISSVTLWLYSAEALMVGQVSVVLALCLRLNLLMGRLLGLLNGLFRNFGTVQNSAELIAREPTVVDAPRARPLTVSDGEITFDAVRFGYGRKSAIIDDLSLTVPAGQRLGIVGHSGVGKTTLTSLLLRFYDVEGGTISIDGQNIADCAQQSLRRSIGVVTQDTALLHRSIHDNIAYGHPDASREDVINAARAANAHTFIDTLSDHRGNSGYDTLVGERGVKLSGGQRQRIALARVFLKNAPILILDEATSALDSEVESAIQESLQSLMKGKTVIAIAHRLSTIAHMDRLIVMDGGKIVEEGTHDVLLAKNRIYARLWQRQSGGFLQTGPNKILAETA
ncbi:MAG: ABC transporter ATP-binding protein [Pseudomonadota bacterium]